MPHLFSRRNLLTMGATLIIAGCSKRIPTFPDVPQGEATLLPDEEWTPNSSFEYNPEIQIEAVTDLEAVAEVAPQTGAPSSPAQPATAGAPVVTSRQPVVTQRVTGSGPEVMNGRVATVSTPIRVKYGSHVYTLDLEEYLRGVVPHESVDSWPAEALRAQAVAARTYARKKMLAARYNGFDIIAGEVDQVWKPESKRNSDAAIAATRGVVMEYGNQPAEIFFYSTSVGASESGSVAFGMNDVPYLRSVAAGTQVPQDMSNEDSFRAFLHRRPSTLRDMFDGGSNKLRWRFTKTRAEVEQELNATRSVRQQVNNATIGTLQDLRVVKRGKSGMVGCLDVVGSNGVARLWPGDAVRVGLGLLSSWFVIDLHRSSNGSIEYVTFTGGGWGHGLGMSQWGAYGMSMLGYNYKQILAHYFPGVSLVQRGI